MRPVLLPCLALALLAAPSSAAPTRASNEARSHMGPDSILFPEDFASQGGTIVLGTTNAGQYRPEVAPYDHENGYSLSWRVPIEDWFLTRLTFDGASPALPEDQRPVVRFGAKLEGELGKNAASAHNLNGFWVGTDIGASVTYSHGFDPALLPGDQRG